MYFGSESWHAWVGRFRISSRFDPPLSLAPFFVGSLASGELQSCLAAQRGIGRGDKYSTFLPRTNFDGLIAHDFLAGLTLYF